MKSHQSVHTSLADFLHELDLFTAWMRGRGQLEGDQATSGTVLLTVVNLINIRLT